MDSRDVLGRIPGLAGYLSGQANDQRMQLGQLQQMGALQGTMARQQEQADRQAALMEQQQIKGVLSQSGGDPAVAVKNLVAAGTPQSLTLAAKLHSLMPKPQNPQFVETTDDKGNPVRKAVIPQVGESFPMPQKESKPPKMRERIQGEKKIQEEYQKDGTWKPIGEGPRFARSVPALGGGNAFGAAQGSLDHVNDKETIKNLATEALYDSNALAGFRRDTKAMGNIMRARTEIMKDAGITAEDVVSGRAGFKADTASLNKITPQYDAITAFEKTAIRNGKILMELADKVDTTGVPVAERWIRLGRKAIGGDPDVAKFDAQMNLYRAEAARILTQPNLSGVLTDTARKEMEEVIRNSATAPQIRGVVNLLERDFLNRKETLEEQISAIRARMRQRVGPGGGAGMEPTQSTPAAPANSVGALTPQEQQELYALRKRFGKTPNGR